MQSKQAVVSRCLELLTNEHIDSHLRMLSEEEDEIEKMLDENKDRFIDEAGLVRMEQELQEGDRQPNVRHGHQFMHGFGMRLCQVQRKVIFSHNFLKNFP